ncbi:hypothetical protein BCR33DRAFT_781727 [Rhizoclosmatium globosum]|uniref:Uncharacterized protein n=1 Tax=Rhizoclosmatium globosum TaxID=329046 RepID=A0A1Y2CR03_9FUNG|nr:hypothetical protein BCR33DRAFT_781727 [Rhizoclosmatium globosum]|eukprot:ORY49461.1 hypothetical protein BCR33DRAFT_781727 [Rhizoclosmatium globosum]
MFLPIAALLQAAMLVAANPLPHDCNGDIVLPVPSRIDLTSTRIQSDNWQALRTVSEISPATTSTATTVAIPTTNANLPDSVKGSSQSFSQSSYNPDVAVIVTDMIKHAPIALAALNASQTDSVFQVSIDNKAITFAGADFRNGSNAAVLILSSSAFDITAPLLSTIEADPSILAYNISVFPAAENGVTFRYILDPSVKSEWFSMQMSLDNSRIEVSAKEENRTLFKISLQVTLKDSGSNMSPNFIALNAVGFLTVPVTQTLPFAELISTSVESGSSKVYIVSTLVSSDNTLSTSSTTSSTTSSFTTSTSKTSTSTKSSTTSSTSTSETTTSTSTSETTTTSSTSTTSTSTSETTTTSTSRTSTSTSTTTLTTTTTTTTTTIPKGYYTVEVTFPSGLPFKKGDEYVITWSWSSPQDPRNLDDVLFVYIDISCPLGPKSTCGASLLFPGPLILNDADVNNGSMRVKNSAYKKGVSVRAGIRTKDNYVLAVSNAFTPV